MAVRNMISLLVLALWATSVTSKASTCPACQNREDLKVVAKERIKSDILRKLYISAPPNVTVTNAHRHVYSGIAHKMEQEANRKMVNDQPWQSDDDHFQPSEANILPSQAPDILESYKHWNILYYKMSSRIMENPALISEANIVLHLPKAPTPHDTSVKVKVYYVGLDKDTYTLFKIDEGTWQLRAERGGKIKVDIADIVRLWIKNPSENLGIVIKAETNTKTVMTIPQPDSDLIPHLQVIFKSASNYFFSRRGKRDTHLQCREEYDQNETQCCQWPLIIDFNEFGWDWIIFPRSYDASICAGDCSLGVLPSSTHTHMLQHKQASSASPCCGARKTSEISMLYMDNDGNVVHGTLPDMKVERCACM